MTKSTYYGAVHVLPSAPSTLEMEDLRDHYSAVHFKGKPCNVSVSAALPLGLPEWTASQLAASKSTLSEDAVFLLVVPAAKDPVRHGKIPS